MGNQRGMTLVELMVVVAIVGILAAIGSVAYGSYMKSGKVSQLEQIAMQVAAGQERYRSRNNLYFPASGSGSDYQVDPTIWKNLLDFDQQVPPDVTIRTESWTGTAGNCGFCTSTVDTSIAGFAVLVTRDLSGEPGVTTIEYTSQSASPMVRNHGL